MFSLCFAQSVDTRTDSGVMPKITRENIPYFVDIEEKKHLKKEVLDYSPKANLEKYPLLEYTARKERISPIKIKSKIPDAILDLPIRIINDQFGRDSITLRELSNDKLLVLDFWSTWCAPCLKSMEKWENLQSKYIDQVRIVGLMLDFEYRAELTIAERKWQVPQLIGPEAAYLNAYFCGQAIVGPSAWIKGNRFVGITKTTSDNEVILKKMNSGIIDKIPDEEEFVNN